MLQQEGGIEITLEMLTVLHFVPTPGKRLFNIFTGQMIILACFDVCRVDLYNIRQPERLAFLPQYFDQHGGCLVGNGLSKPLFASGFPVFSDITVFFARCVREDHSIFPHRNDHPRTANGSPVECAGAFVFQPDGAADISVPVGSSDIAWTYYVLT